MSQKCHTNKYLLVLTTIYVPLFSSLSNLISPFDIAIRRWKLSKKDKKVIDKLMEEKIKTLYYNRELNQ